MPLSDLQSAPSASTRRWFGISLASLLLLLAVVLRVPAPWLALLSLVAGLLLGCFYYAVPAWQPIIIGGWKLVTYPLTWIVGHLLLGSVFFLVLLPLAFLVRLFAHDPLQIKPGKPDTSWTARCPQRPVKDYFKQF